MNPEPVKAFDILLCLEDKPKTKKPKPRPWKKRKR